jgi:hypothetical protein
VPSPHHHQQKRGQVQALRSARGRGGVRPLQGHPLFEKKKIPARAPNSPKQAPGTNIGSSNQHLIALSCGATPKSLRGFMAVHVLPKEWSDSGEPLGSWSVHGPRDTCEPRGLGVGILVPIFSLVPVCASGFVPFFRCLETCPSEKYKTPRC